MSDMFDIELTWNGETDEVHDTAPEFTNFPEFGTWQLVAIKKVQTTFNPDHRIELPDVIINGVPWSRGGLQEGWSSGSNKNAVVYAIRHDGINMKTDEPFTTVLLYLSATNVPVEKSEDGLLVKVTKERGEVASMLVLNKDQKKIIEDKNVVWISEWSNLQYPALKQSLTPEQLDNFGNGKPLHYRAEMFTYRIREDKKGNLDNEGRPKRYFDNIRYNFTIYANESEMAQAREAYRNKNETDSTLSNANYVTYPKVWGNSVPACLESGTKAFASGSSIDSIVTTLMLVEGNSWTLNHNGDPVDGKTILRECVEAVDVPEELLANKLYETKASMLEAIEKFEIGENVPF